MSKPEEKQKMRLNKYIAACGVCSRREADTLIFDGRVMVNGKAAEPGMQVSTEDIILVNGKEVTSNPKVVLAYNKPVGVTCTEKDSFADRVITKEIDYQDRVTYAGRLDKQSEGLMILTNDGDLIQAMMKGANHHEKEYIVRVNKKITPEFIQKMKAGIFLSELNIKTRKCEVFKIDDFTFQIILTQGVNRQIRRMCKELNYEVKALKRIRVMNILLGDLKEGEYRVIEGKELEILKKDSFGNSKTEEGHE